MFTFSTLIKQTAHLLGQASLSISYTRHLNFLKTLLKDPRKAKTLLKEKTALLQESESQLFGKKFCSYTTKSSNRDQNKNIPFQNNASTSARKSNHAGSASNGKYFFYNSPVIQNKFHK